jgi:hypothetical protein
MAESFSALLVHSEFASAFCPVSVSLLDGDGVASAEEIRMAMPHDRCFSPLLDGDGVASVSAITAQTAILRFSPLLDGDGVASNRGPPARKASPP